MLALLLFGIVHVVFLWRGDILVQYALLGCVLVLYRDLKPRALLVAAALTWIALPYLIIRTRLALHQIPVPFSPHGVQDWIYAHGTYAQVMPVRIRDFLDWYGRWPFGVFPGFLVLFVLGLWAERVGLMSRFGEYLPAIRRAFWVALGVAVLGLLLGFGLDRIWPPPTELPFDWRKASFWSPRWTIARAVADLYTWGTAAVYGTGLVLLAQRPKWGAVLAPLTFVGRMPLTTYLTQSLVCSLLFYGYGLGWYGTVSYSGMLTITCILFAAQILASRWWLRRFRFGPAEWLWRSVAYARRQPMRITVPEAAGASSGL
jgi:uncharacterized protein